MEKIGDCMIEIAYACDENYIPQTGISMISIFDNYKGRDKIRVWLVDFGVKDKSCQLLREICEKSEGCFEVVSGKSVANDLNIDMTGRHIASIYAKILFSELIPVRKVLYLDSDTIVSGSIDEMYNISMGNFWIAGVETISSVKRNKQVGLGEDDIYLNDGVLLINLDQWNKDHVTDICKKYIQQWNGNPPVLSEGTIAHVCKERSLRLEPRYNLLSGIVYFNSKEIEMMTGRKFYSEEERTRAIQSPCVIHYLSALYKRPWEIGCSHPLKDQYLKYKDMSPWKTYPLVKKKLSIRLVLIDRLHRYLPTTIFLKLKQIFGE